ncbi:MAG: (Fe-S)-binding protein, partial [Spirochaetota bacterium]
ELKKHSTAESIGIPAHIARQYRNIEYNGTIYPARRSNASLLFDLGLVSDVRTSSDYDYLLFLGCYYSNTPDRITTVINFLKICAAGGYRIGILGSDETCCGDTALRSGNTDLFHTCASRNIQNFIKHGITKIITMCPHGYNTLNREYPHVTSTITKSREHIKIIFYTDIIHDMQKKNHLVFSSLINKRIVYHDPCFLGRYNSYYRTPREILSLLPGTDVQEMNRHGVLSVCCGYSGAIAETNKRIAYKLGEFRAMEAVTAGADIIATACPFCELSIREGSRDIQQESIEVRNICDIVASATDL